MLTPFHPQDGLEDELKLDMLQSLVKSSDFPHSLIAFGRTSRHANALSKDWSVWREALRVYFPAIVSLKQADFLKDPYLLFQTLTRHITPLLREHSLTMADFVSAVVEQKSNLTNESLDAIQGLLLSAGHPLLNNAPPTAAIHEYALLYSAALGNTPWIDGQLATRPFLLSSRVVNQAMIIAAKLGRQFIISSLINHAFQALDSTTIRNALLSTAENNHARVAALFLQPPCLRVVTFTLKAVCRLAMTKNCPDILSLILRNNEQYRYASELRLGALEAAELGFTDIIAHAYKLAPAQFDDATIRKLLKAAIRLNNRELMILFMTHPAINRHPASILESIQVALASNQEALALLLLQAGRNQLKIYVKRELMMEAVRKGFSTIVHDLITADNLKLDETFLKTARNIAKIYQQPATAALLKQFIAPPLSGNENASHAQEVVESLSTSIEQLSINEQAPNTPSANKFTPNFLRKSNTVVSFHEPKLIKGTSKAPVKL